MSRDGSGTYNLPAGNPVITGSAISSTWANNTLTDIATALTASIASDGQTPITANISLGTHKLTDVMDGAVATDVATVGQLLAGTAFNVYLSVNQTANGTIKFDTNRTAQIGGTNYVIATGIFTVPAGAGGTYVFSASISKANTSGSPYAGSAQMVAIISASTWIIAADSETVSNGSAGALRSLSAVVTLSAGDTVYIQELNSATLPAVGDAFGFTTFSGARIK